MSDLTHPGRTRTHLLASIRKALADSAVDLTAAQIYDIVNDAVASEAERLSRLEKSTGSNNDEGELNS